MKYYLNEIKECVKEREIEVVGKTAVDEYMEDTNINENGTFALSCEETICSLRDDCNVSNDNNAEEMTKEMKEIMDRSTNQEFLLKGDIRVIDRRDADNAYKTLLGEEEMYTKGKKENEDSEKEMREDSDGLYRKQEHSYIGCIEVPVSCSGDSDSEVDHINNKPNDDERQINGNIVHDNDTETGVDGYIKSGVDCDKADSNNGRGKWYCQLNGNISKSDSYINDESKFSHGCYFDSTSGGITVTELGGTSDFKLEGNSESKPHCVELDGDTLTELVLNYVYEFYSYFDSNLVGRSVIKQNINSTGEPGYVLGNESVREIDSESIAEVDGASMCEQDSTSTRKEDSDITCEQDSDSASEQESDDDQSWVTANFEEVIHDDVTDKHSYISFKGG